MTANTVVEKCIAVYKVGGNLDLLMDRLWVLEVEES